MRVLFVDDEISVLQGLQRLLRPMRQQWEMHFAQRAPDALAFMETTPVDLVIADIRMPGMDGIALLQDVKKRFPRTVRFVLSGQSNMEYIYRAVSPAHQFLAKPCDPELLKQTITRAFALRRLLSGDHLRTLIAQIRMLPSIPPLYLKVMHELRSPEASLQAVGHVIAQDLAMSAKVLQLVNSSFFGLPQTVGNPAQAVGLLGLDTIRSLVLMFDVFAQFKGAAERTDFSLVALQQHSITVSAFARAIARHARLDEKMAGDIFMAGLFHDLGKLILLANIPAQYARALGLAQDTDKRLTLADAEFSVLGATHTEIGAYLLGLWGFADPIIEATAFHHTPSQAPPQCGPAVGIVHAANVIAHELLGTADSVRAPEYDGTYVDEKKIARHIPAWREVCQHALLDTGGLT